MFPIRRAALRFLSSPSTSFIARSRTITSLSQSPFRTQKQTVSLVYQRRWASDEAKKDEVPLSKLQPTPAEEVENVIQEDNASQTIDSSTEPPSDPVQVPAASAPGVTETAEPSRAAQPQDSPVDFSQDAVRGEEFSHATPYRSATESSFSSRARDSFGQTAPEHRNSPKQTLYVGNLFFDVTEDDLTKEMARFGKIERVRLIRDARGLSKGFGYVSFSTVEEATKALSSLNQQLFEGRRLAISYAANNSAPAVRRPRTAEKATNPPSKTLFIGNMSWDMTDKDLNELFRGIKNIIDVRVAMDRRTGQPRGFAHADFTDVKSAMEGLKVLQGKETYGRALRIDYSYGAGNAPRNQARDRGDL